MSGLFFVFIVSLLISEGNATYLRNDAWQTEESLSKDNIAKSPNNIRPKISLASHYLGLRKVDEALDLIRESEDILKSGKVRVQKNWIGILYHNYGTAYYQKNEYDKAMSYLLKSLEYDNYSWKTHSLLGFLFFSNGDVDQAVKALTNSVNLYQNNAKIFNMFGRALYASGDVETALLAFQKGLAVAENQGQAGILRTIRLNIIACHLKLGHPVNAKRTFQLIEVNSNDEVYLLYQTIIFPEVIEESLLSLAHLLISNKTEFCVWRKELKENRLPGIIYPSIKGFERDLADIYNKELGKLKLLVEQEMNNVSKCMSMQETSSDS